MKRIKLTADNYYSKEANEQYMSASQFKSFIRCESAALAEVRGEWNRPDTTALLVGSFVDAFFSNEMEQFLSEHPETRKKDGSLKAEFVQAQKICERMCADPLSSMLQNGKHQVIKTGKIAGVWFKAKYDSLLLPSQVKRICKKFPEVKKLFPFGFTRMVVDLKCMKDFKPIWNEDEHIRQHWIEYYGYDIQGAIYQALSKGFLPFVINAVSKESEPDIGAFLIDDNDLAERLHLVEELAPRYAAIKKGKIAPVPCGRCAYCRQQKKLTAIPNYKMIGD